MLYEWKSARAKANGMKKASAKELAEHLRPVYDLSKLKGGVRGKYHGRAVAGTNLVLIEPQPTQATEDDRLRHPPTLRR